MSGIGSHQAATPATMHWITPRPILEAIGHFDLDPCAHVEMPWRTASEMLTIRDNGLMAKWHGRVWLNPPYGREIGDWMQKMAKHQNGVALIFARTETSFWHKWIWPYATAALFLEGRLHFHYPDGRRAAANAGAPSVLLAYSEDDAWKLASSGLKGRMVTLNAKPDSARAPVSA